MYTGGRQKGRQRVCSECVERKGGGASPFMNTVIGFYITPRNQRKEGGGRPDFHVSLAGSNCKRGRIGKGAWERIMESRVFSEVRALLTGLWEKGKKEGRINRGFSFDRQRQIQDNRTTQTQNRQVGIM